MIKYIDENGLRKVRELVETELNGKQETLISGTNIKTVNGQTLLGEGNIATTAYQPIPSSWTTYQSTSYLCSSIVDDASAVEGMAYLGKISCYDLPGGLGQGEAVIEIISNDGTNGKNIHIILTSADRAPYRWEYSYVKINGSYGSPAGWVGYQPQLVSGTNIKTIDGTTLLGSGDLVTKPYKPFRSGWSSYLDGTTADFCQAVYNDSGVVANTVYFGNCRFSDLPQPLNNAEVLVEVIDGYYIQKVIYLTLKSGEHSPYHWEFSWYYNHDVGNPSGWHGFQPELVSGTNIKTVNGVSLLGSGDLSIDAAPLEETTWSALKAKRDGGTLVPGKQYRITDYNFTTANIGTSSANHQFDIIVTADSESALNEVARASLHSGDTYFVNNKLEAWKLWYCLDNDATRFKWADTTNGKGVVYRMIDEFNNDLPYDFKNYMYFNNIGGTQSAFVYTFTYTDDGIKDASISVDCRCYGNTIAASLDAGKQRINNIIFYSSGVQFDVFDNRFDANCGSLKFGKFAYRNRFERGCSDCSFKDSFQDNEVKAGCYMCRFGDHCISNVLGGADIRTGSYCEGNVILHARQGISLGSHCSDNVITRSHGIVLGNYCKSINVADGCSDISIGAYGYARNIYVGGMCKYLEIESSDVSASDSNWLQNVRICAGLCGTDSSNRLTLTVPDRNLNYETTFKANDSTEILI